MATTKVFSGVITALITPFKTLPTEWPSIDFETFDNLIEWQISCGVSGLVIFGTTGESATLDDSEKLELIQRAKDVIRGRVQLIAGTGSNNTKKSIELTKKVRELGIDGALAVAPYYNKPTQEGLFQHFSTIAREGELPLIVYNVPGRTGVEISVDTLSKLAKVENIVAVKQAVDSATTLMELSAAVSDKISILAGDDPLTYFVMSCGGHGVISASASVIPKEMVAITKEYERGNLQASCAAQQRVLPVIRTLFMETNPAPAKAALKHLGLIPSDTLRLPLVPVRDETRTKVISAVNALQK